MTTKYKKVFFVAVERRERVSVRTSRLRLRKINCPACRATEMLLLDSAVTLFGLPTGALVRLAEQGAFHSIEATSGHLLVCRESLRNFIENARRGLS